MGNLKAIFLALLFARVLLSAEFVISFNEDLEYSGIDFLDTTKFNKEQCYEYFDNLRSAGVPEKIIQEITLNCSSILSSSGYEQRKVIKRKNSRSRKSEERPRKRAKTNNPRIGVEYQVDFSRLAAREESIERGGILIHNPTQGSYDYQRLAHEDAQNAQGLMNATAPIVRNYVNNYIKNTNSQFNATSFQEHRKSLFDIATYFEENQELSNAAFYYDLSAELGCVKAQKRLETWEEKAKPAPAPAAPVFVVKEKAKKILEGDGQEDINWGIAFFYGDHENAIDKKRAKICFQEAKRFGHKEACYWLGKYYEEKNDLNNALKNYIISARKESGDAQYTLGVYYFNQYQKNIKPQENLKQAVAYYKLAAENGHMYAQNDLAALYEAGEGVKKNPKQAVMWYERAALQGFGIAQYNLALCYEEGFFVKQDKSQARKYFKLAAENGHEEAQAALKSMN
jgi:TPR repeat protein